MTELPLEKKINIVGIGIIASILLFLAAYTIFARTLVISKKDNIGLLFLVISLEFITFISSVFVSIWQTDDLSDTIALKSAGISFLVNLGVICALSYTSLFLLYPDIFEGLQGIDYAIVFPTVLLDFSIYVLGHPIYLFILSIFTYFLLFIIILDYEYTKEGEKSV